MEDKKTFVIGLGGSLILPEPGKFDHDYIHTFKTFIQRQIEEHNHRFIVIIGGGKNARVMQDQYRYYKNKYKEAISNEALDRIGIEVTRTNAQTVKQIFGNITHPLLYSNHDKPMPNNFKHILFGGGWKPGFSTDYCAMEHAIKQDLAGVINLSNTNYAFDKDPNEYEDAKPFRTVTWEDYRQKIPSDWAPGASAPFDPEASRRAHERDKIVKIMASDPKLQNLEAAINGGPTDFEGTLLGAEETIYLQ